MGLDDEGYRLETRLFDEQGMFGTLDERLDFADGYFLGKAVGTFLQHKHSRIYACIASDSHPLSVPLESEIVRGLLECGVRVLSFNISPAPLVRFAASELRAQIAFSVSCGSLPATHSGVKMFLEGSALDAERARQLRNIAASGNWRNDAGGHLVKSEGVDAYTTRLFADAPWRHAPRNAEDRAAQHSAKHAGGHAAGHAEGQKSGRILPRLLLAQSAYGASGEVFAAVVEKLVPHSSQVLVLKDVHALNEALATGEPNSLGFLFNGDATALRVFSGAGRALSPERLFGLLLRGETPPQGRRAVLTDGLVSREACRAWEEAGVLVRPCSQFGAGLLPLLSRHRDAFASVSSDGHIALCNRYYPFEDAFYVAFRLLALLAVGSVLMSEIDALAEPFLAEPLPAASLMESLAKSEGEGVLRVALENPLGNNKDAFFAKLRSWVKAHDKSPADSAQQEREVERTLSDGRWVVRAARFEGVLFIRCEGEDEVARQRVKADLAQALAECGIE